MSRVLAARRPVGRVAVVTTLLAALLSGMVALVAAAPAGAQVAHYAPSEAKAYPRLSIGSRGDAVRYVQLRLGVIRTGYFGNLTAAAVLAFEKRHGFRTADSVVGYYTWRALHVPYAPRTASTAGPSPSASTSSTGWTRPIRSYRLSARFGQAGSLWSSGYHTGQDFSAPTGTPVYSAAAGTVSAKSGGAYGNKLTVTHSGGTQTWYAHLSAYVRTSGSVAAGTLIGRVGATGNTTGPHLHFEVRSAGGTAVDPMAWLRSRGVSM